MSTVIGFRRFKFKNILPPPVDNMPPFATEGWSFSGPHHSLRVNSTSYKEFNCYVDNWVSTDTGWGSGYSPEWNESTAQNITFTGQYEGGGNYNWYITVQGFKNSSWTNIDDAHATNVNNSGNWYSFSKTVDIKGYKKIRLYIQTEAKNYPRARRWQPSYKHNLI